MALGILSKLAMAGIVLTSVTGAATLGGVSSIAHEVHAEENANQEHFEKTLEGKVLNFKDVLSKNTISIKDFSKAVENELKNKGFDPSEYKLKFKVKVGHSVYQSSDGGNLIVGNEHIGTATAEFNPTKHKLGVYESEIEKIIDYIIKNITFKDLDVSVNMQNKIFQYIHLQYLRTDAGRINFMNLIENPFTYKPRKKPIDLDEIQKHKNTIIKFNEIFKQGNNLENLLKRMKKPSNMNFHIAISEDNLLTSDNPVIATDNWNQIMLPITPNILIEFQEDKINSSNDLRVILKKNKTRYVNEATINTANYFVISNKEFTRYQYKYIDNRFNNKNWEIGYPHVNLKN
ncbi:DUF4238 domain-containing protein [Staphylococcus aureus]|uniref:DUF4238 domain-containing protein n=1 Tax=Staphylococcus aureus TaxID=1280 RepID=UPI001C29AFB6|nr:DUF4238 domain-containing protein [Staphylococcus aureus]EJX2117706.1 DUF4238 domain-containing protein [Staphylococcus aureus]MBX4347944.1 DUF4238 domain-containing protein [Staphylococcus aureus]MBX4360838.1 DUF4238 domain-containing protein [Staphylococcus aureus]HAR4265559.1 DUF4238 domain-containing protein [Staphylococcus aureus]HAR4356633.1 DUF4238 domain-containing protein [Staphylococcus aureus]